MWFWLIVGVLQLPTGVLILQRNEWGVWLGAGFGCVSAPMTVFVMFVFPLWAIAVLTLDFLILYALLSRSDAFTGDGAERARGRCVWRTLTRTVEVRRHVG